MAAATRPGVQGSFATSLEASLARSHLLGAASQKDAMRVHGFGSMSRGPDFPKAHCWAQRISDVTAGPPTI